jgi:TonB family protein
MTAEVVGKELSQIRARTRRAVWVSVLIHVGILVVFWFGQATTTASEGITEITWITPAKPEPEQAPAPTVRETRQASGEDSARQRPAPKKSEIQFQREKSKAQVSPRPQERAAVRDRMRERLASLQTAARDRRTQTSALAAPIPTRPSLAGLPEESRGEKVELVRERVTRGSAVQLVRSSPMRSPPNLALSRMTEEATTRTSLPPPTCSVESKEILTGISLSGPVADRALISYQAPDYPEWAKREAVEGSVSLYFEVLPGGKVKKNILVQKTSGFEDFDHNATLALLNWYFEPLGNGMTGEQWGSITLNYRLDDARSGWSTEPEEGS